MRTEMMGHKKYSKDFTLEGKRAEAGRPLRRRQFWFRLGVMVAWTGGGGVGGVRVVRCS